MLNILSRRAWPAGRLAALGAAPGLSPRAVKGFVGTMKNARWVQRGEAVANPYLGTVMPTCGVPIKGGAQGRGE
jgi:hypothetical protein